ncbi:resolvase [Stappia sp. GBMRC 2046]|uniref:Resolvase n=1 Tax=Stappia sediminis TaxID=2692190 RepID=A0A7X3LWU0_9HYPH|nr:recombinase family protein [Stappia sediminis]MXN66513.1 resolvase [Stappia sediminis]
MAAGKTGARRCAIYTRKSSEEGLDQAFNSLHAQREACEAFVASQAGEGWRVLPEVYDDGGFSGGSMNRPALTRLLADIEAGRIDIIVVYKVDRLTRSLPDFARIVDIFDTNGVSFVSVTQQFNTTTSMGRLTLNMLLSFAQFEREVTGERIRDKIAASKRKGMWMGGPTPLGYEVDGRTLTINEAEAATIRTIYRLYLEFGSVPRVKEEADRRGLVSKVFTSARGRTSGGRSLSRGHIYRILSNPLYIGCITHKGEVFEGRHPAIVDPETWQAVQAQLKENGSARLKVPRKTAPSPLAGRLFDEAGEPLTPSHAVKSGRRYRYYVSRHLISGSVRGNGPSNREDWRLPARELERIVEGAVRNLLDDPSGPTGAARCAGVSLEALPRLMEAAGQWRDNVLRLVEHVTLLSNGITLALTLAPLTGEETATIEHFVPLRLKRRGVEKRLVIQAPGINAPQQADPALVKALARAHKWFDDLVTGRAASLAQIAKAEGVTDRYISHLLPLAFLAPDIVEAILAGTHPPDLTVDGLVKRIDMPLDWQEQREAVGIDA